MFLDFSGPRTSLHPALRHEEDTHERRGARLQPLTRFNLVAFALQRAATPLISSALVPRPFRFRCSANRAISSSSNASRYPRIVSTRARPFCVAFSPSADIARIVSSRSRRKDLYRVRISVDLSANRSAVLRETTARIQLSINHSREAGNVDGSR